MNVKEALVNVFNIKVVKRVMYDTTLRKYVETGEDIIEEFYMRSMADDRSLLKSNFESKVLFLESIGQVGIIGFKMRNHVPAFFYFNKPGELRHILRVKPQELGSELKHLNNFKESIKNPINIHDEEFMTKVDLMLITGGK